MTSKRDKIKQNRSQLYRQNEELEMEAKRKRTEKKLLLWKGNVLTDISKLVFAGVVIGSIFSKDPSWTLIFGIGFAVFMFLLYFGYRYYKRGII